MDIHGKNRLSEIFFAHHENLSDKWEQYLAIYEAELRRFVDLGKPIRLLEIGVQNGGSLQVWSKYFPQGSRITGIDIVDKCGELKLGENVEVHVGDASDKTRLDEMLRDATFDVIVDDGSHRSEHIISTFLACFGRMEAGGVYIAEDLHCSYMASHGGGFRTPGAAIEFFKALSDSLNVDWFERDAFESLDEAQLAFLREMNRSIASISFYDSVVVIHKLPAEKVRPYRRLVTGRDMPVSDPSANVAAETPARLREFVLSPAAASAFGPQMIELLATAKENIGRLTAVNDQANADLSAARRQIDDLAARVSRLDREREELAVKVHDAVGERQRSSIAVDSLKEEQAVLVGRLNTAKDESLALRRQIDDILGSTSWKIASPIRVLGTQLKHRSHLVRRVLAAKRMTGGWKPLARVVRRTLRESGWKGVARRSLQVDALANGGGRANVLQERLQARLAEVAARFAAPLAGSADAQDGPLISILMPVYRTPLAALRDAIESVRQQTYGRWQLCIVDDASKSPELEVLLKDFAARDKRIVLRIAESNGGISRATNQAIDLATGDYVALFDHDDLLTHDALEAMVAAIATNPAADLFYSDECKVDAIGTPVEIYSKPDWSPLLMMSSMYIGHLSVYRRDLLERAGRFRSEYDFSQDYDLALRAMESATHIVHVPKVLYGWRMIEASGAAGGKPYARISNVKALQDAASRRNWDAEAVPLPSANYLNWRSLSEATLVSLIVPSDNATNISATIESIKSKTEYGAWEVLVVTNSGIVDQLTPQFASDTRIRFVRYDKPFNFSDKCNVGAEQARGEYVVFFNDDVRVITGKWIQRLLEVMRLPGVGAVAPKLLYEDGTIQHAGMVTGVRRLVGTAFHCLESTTPQHYNLAQCIREVSLLCGACIALPKRVFDQVHGFDAKDAPISHSDVDLCFKVRDLGLSCIYTPYAELVHIGHASIGETEKVARVQKKAFKQDKADIFLLRRWAQMVSTDPFFTKPMREQLFHDSPEQFEIFAPATQAPAGGRDILLISHDLTMSGAPRLLFEMAAMLKKAGHFVVVATPADGAYRQPLVDLGIPVICDELVLTGSDHLFDLAKNFDIVVGNTVLCWRDLARLSTFTKTYLYSHESQIVSDHFANLPGFADSIRNVTGVIAASERAAAHLRKFRDDITIIPGFGADELRSEPYSAPVDGQQLVVTLIGSKESRKGQDIAIEAVKLLERENNAPVTLNLFGRNHEPSFVNELERRAAGLRNVVLGPELPHGQYLEALKSSDIVLSAARDDTLPLVSLDALALGRVLVCTRETGTSDFLVEGKSGFIASAATPEAVATALRNALARSADWGTIGAAAHEVFETTFTRHAFHERVLTVLELEAAASARAA